MSINFDIPQVLDHNERTGRYELSLSAEDMVAVYQALKATAASDPDGLVAAVVDALENDGVEDITVES